jgi:ATP-dependent exoDNAse (exonuclease V) beta subunit
MSPNLILYQASAGSGKTYQLSLSYLKLLKCFSQSKKEALKGILAITFTNKAVYEMKDRIISFLKEIALKTNKGLILAQESGLTPQEAENFLEEIFLHYDYLEIRTIDSFLLKLFRGLAYELNLHPDFKIKNYLDDTHIERALIRLFEKAQLDEKIWQFLEAFVDFLLSYEDSLKINFKSKIISELEKLVNLSTYREELLRTNEEFDTFEENSSDKPTTSLRGHLYFKLWNLLKEELEKVLNEEGTLYMGIWKEKLAQTLQRDFLPWIYLKLGNLQAFIIDEFQDTDKLQWTAIFPLVEDLISNRKLFLAAGDTKQSIYRWKGGDPGLIRSLKENLRDYGLSEKNLNFNFRSSLSIVEFNNSFFNFLKNEEELKKEILKRIVFGKNDKKPEEDLLSLAQSEFDELFSHITQSANKDHPGKVFIEWLPVKGETQKLANALIYQKIKDILEELKNKDSLENTAILMRENKEVIEMSAYLLSQGFSVIGSSFLKLKESPLINTLVSYLRLLYGYEDEISLATVLLGLFKERGKEILLNYQKIRPFKNLDFTLLSYLKTYESSFYKEALEIPLSKGRLLNIYQFVRFLVSFFSLEEAFPQEKPYLYKFLSLLLRFTAQEGDPLEFLDNWENLAEEEEVELPEESSSIKVMTIHKSKGLEFSKVIVPLNFNTRRYQPPLGLLFTEKGVHKGKKDELPQELLYLYYLEKIQHSLEIFNLFYVAFTRAMQNLYILVPVGLKNNFDSAEIFIQIFESLKEQVSVLKVKNFLVERSLNLHNF